MSEHVDDVTLDAELVELFRRRRPDPDAFRARVAERIVEKEREPNVDVPRERSILRTEFLRRAAAFLPLDPSAAAFGKIILTTLALPFIVLVASVGAFVAAAKSVVRTGSTAQPAVKEPSYVQMASSGRLKSSSYLVQSLQTIGMFALLLPAAIGSAWAVDIVVALVLLAAGALVLVVRGLSTDTLLTPRTVSTQAIAILASLFAGAFLWPASRQAAAAGSDLGIGWAASVVLAGMVVCALLPRQRPSWGSVGWLLFLTPLLLLNPMGRTNTSPANLRKQVANYDVEALELRAWEELGLVTEALAAVGERVPSMPAVERELESVLARSIEDKLHVWREGVDAHPAVWTAALHAGLMTHDRWCALASRADEKRGLDGLLKLSGPLRTPVYNEYQVAMLVATREISPEQRETLASHIEAAWPERGSHDPLANALLIVRLLDHLGFVERANARRADVHALLVEHWTGTMPLAVFLRMGGFTPNPERFKTSLAGPTHAAAVLMARFGVPEGIDLRLVRAYLRVESAAPWLGIPESAYLKGVSRAALLRLERDIGIPPRSKFEAVVGERVLIACALLVLLCVLAIRSAPRVSASVTTSALP